MTELNQVPAAATVIALHPAVLARYEEQLNQLQVGLAKGLMAGDSESAEAMRDLIETVTVFRDPSRPRRSRSRNRRTSNGTPGGESLPQRRQSVGGMVVAGEGYRQYSAATEFVC